MVPCTQKKPKLCITKSNPLNMIYDYSKRTYRQKGVLNMKTFKCVLVLKWLKAGCRSKNCNCHETNIKHWHFPK